MTNKELTPETAPFVFIEWEDIQYMEDWNDKSETNDTCSLVSAGWLIENTPRKYTLASTYDYENEEWAHKHSIGRLPPVVTLLKVIKKGYLNDEGVGKIEVSPDGAERPIKQN